MGKTHQALQRAEKEHQASYLSLRSQKDLPAATTSSLPATTRAKYEDEYESLKNSLLSRYQPEELKIIVFTSARSSDGTSTTAANFARAMARDSWRTVFLIDANFRHPSLHEMFQMDYKNGLADFLEDENNTIPQFKKIKDNFYLHTTGSLRYQSFGLFNSAKFSNYLEIVSQNFDHVILDCPPASAHAETRIIAGKADGVIFVLNSGKTSQNAALRAKKNLEEIGVKMLGVVLNNRQYHIPDWLYSKL